MELGKSIMNSIHDMVYPVYMAQTTSVYSFVDHKLHSLIINLLRRSVYNSVNNSVRSGIVNSLTSNELKLW